MSTDPGHLQSWIAVLGHPAVSEGGLDIATAARESRSPYRATLNILGPVSARIADAKASGESTDRHKRPRSRRASRGILSRRHIHVLESSGVRSRSQIWACSHCSHPVDNATGAHLAPGSPRSTPGQMQCRSDRRPNIILQIDVRSALEMASSQRGKFSGPSRNSSIALPCDCAASATREIRCLQDSNGVPKLDSCRICVRSCAVRMVPVIQMHAKCSI